MQYNKLGKTDLKISNIGYGSWPLAGKGWQGVNKHQAIKSLKLAIELGVNFIDTAPIYGLGRAEIAIGEITKNIRNKLVIATKCGLTWNDTGKVEHNLSYSSIMYDIENSLKRLQTDYIDLYQVHWPDPGTPLKETFKTLNKLKSEKVIKHIGICNYNLKLLQESLEYAEIVSLQAKYNYLEREVEQYLLPFCSENQISFIAYSSLAQGLLGGKINENYKLISSDIRKFNPLFKDKEKFHDSLNKVSKLGKNPAQKSLKYLLANKNVTSVLISMTKEKHVKQNIKIMSK